MRSRRLGGLVIVALSALTPLGAGAHEPDPHQRSFDGGPTVFATADLMKRQADGALIPAGSFLVVAQPQALTDEGSGSSIGGWYELIVTEYGSPNPWRALRGSLPDGAMTLDERATRATLDLDSDDYGIHLAWEKSGGLNPLGFATYWFYAAPDHRHSFTLSLWMDTARPANVTGTIGGHEVRLHPFDLSALSLNGGGRIAMDPPPAAVEEEAQGQTVSISHQAGDAQLTRTVKTLAPRPQARGTGEFEYSYNANACMPPQRFEYSRADATQMVILDSVACAAAFDFSGPLQSLSIGGELFREDIEGAESSAAHTPVCSVTELCTMRARLDHPRTEIAGYDTSLGIDAFGRYANGWGTGFSLSVGVGYGVCTSAVLVTPTC